jgi:nucleotide-binding universal stress UspA family protein
MTPPTLLVAVDLTPHAVAVCEHAVDLARRLDARVLLLHVVQLRGDLKAETLVRHPRSGETVEAAVMLRGDADKHLAPLLALFAGVPVEVEVRGGDVVDCVLALARERDPLQVLLGASASTGLKRLFEKRIAARLAAESPRPVVLVPPVDDADDRAMSTAQLQVLAEGDG